MTTNVEWPGKLQTENPVFQLILSDSRFAETFKLNILMSKWLDEVGENNLFIYLSLKECVCTRSGIRGDKTDKSSPYRNKCFIRG